MSTEKWLFSCFLIGKVFIGNKNLACFIQLSCLNYDTEKTAREDVWPLILQNPVAQFSAVEPSPHPSRRNKFVLHLTAENSKTLEVTLAREMIAQRKRGTYSNLTWGWNPGFPWSVPSLATGLL